MKRRCFWRAGLLGAFFVICATSMARAEEKRPCVEEAEKKYNMADFEGALKTLNKCLKQVRANADRACIHTARGFNLAELRRPSSAKKAFHKGIRLDQAACGCSTAYKEELTVACRAERAKMKGTLVVRCNQIGAEVMIDGASKGKAPITVSLPIGSYLITVRVPSGERRTQKVHIPEGRKVSVTVNIPGDSPPSAARAKEGRLWTWVAGGLAVAAAGVATGVWFAGEGQYDEWEEIAALEKTRALTATEEQDLADLQSTVEQKEVAAYALWGVAGAAAAAAVVLFFVEGPDRKEASSQRASVFPLVGGVNGLGARLEF